jgi:hypothetical protein
VTFEGGPCHPARVPSRIDVTPAKPKGEDDERAVLARTLYSEIIRCCRHLLSTKPNGVEIQVYCGIIACLLIMLYTGCTPTKRTFEMACFFLSGWANPEDLERHINARPKPGSKRLAEDGLRTFESLARRNEIIGVGAGS